MPYGTYHTGETEAVRAALRLVKEGGAEAVKLEGGRNRVEVIRRLVNEEIPVMGHIDRKSTRLNSSHDQISYAVFCLKKKKKKKKGARYNKKNTNSNTQCASAAF